MEQIRSDNMNGMVDKEIEEEHNTLKKTLNKSDDVSNSPIEEKQLSSLLRKRPKEMVRIHTKKKKE